MISPLINSMIIAAFGFMIGIFFTIAGSVLPARSRILSPTSSDRRSWRGFIDEALKRSEEGKEMAREAPPKFWVGSLLAYGFIAMLILVIRISSLTMNWPVFLVTMFIGYSLFQWIFNQAKSGKISSPSSSSDNSSPTAS